jgi:hypothetical protein
VSELVKRLMEKIVEAYVGTGGLLTADVAEGAAQCRAAVAAYCLHDRRAVGHPAPIIGSSECLSTAQAS